MIVAIVIICVIILLAILYSACVVSGRCAREEEKYYEKTPENK